MSRNGDTRMEFNEKFFERVLRKPGVETIVDDIAARTAQAAKASAPVDTGEYRDGIRLEQHESHYRRTTRVVGTDAKTMLIESQTGNLARALKSAKS